ncbi:hypothetical protein [Bacillus alkalicellulosilyticus]|uniref:hypothetical protein n=1 Tax=Alkalihalobacterium alkalicellulosilyticum TaxID=1912214 RepID=UPI0009987B41|nr:hypothetical protein [Bacillus alkalicellulosilyticus]
MFEYANGMDLLLIINPMLFLLLGVISGLFVSNWKKNVVITPTLIVGLTFLVTLVFQSFTYDHFLFVYGIAYALIGLFGIGFSTLSKKLVTKIFTKSA